MVPHRYCLALGPIEQEAGDNLLSTAHKDLAAGFRRDKLVSMYGSLKPPLVPQLRVPVRPEAAA